MATFTTRYHVPGGSGADCRSASSWRTIQKERAAILLQACIEIMANAQAGEASATSEILRLSAKLNGQPYQSCPGRTLELSKSTLRRVYFNWKREKFSPKALFQQYAGVDKPVPREALDLVVRECLRPGVIQIMAAWRAVRGKHPALKGSSFWNVRRRLPSRLLEKIRALHQERKAAAAALMKAREIARQVNAIRRQKSW